MNKIIFLLIIALTSINLAFAATGNVEAGKIKAAMCAACHGANGIGTTDTYPNLAGQHADYIAKQLKAFKSGTRIAPLMGPMAAGLSEQDMADLGAYFASLDRSGSTALAENSVTETSTSVAVQAPVVYVRRTGHANSGQLSGRSGALQNDQRC